MDWSHEVSIAWLEARKYVVTATELVSLISEFTRMSKANAGNDDYIPPAFAALWEKKHSTEQLDPRSFNAAARGHIMEPYAIKSYNHCTGRSFFHWDDAIICSNGVGFSPDALDVMQPDTDSVTFTVEKGKLCSNVGPIAMPTEMLEIKSYGPENHAKNMITDKMKLKERYQIAVGMMVLPSIKTGHLIHFCPQAEHSLYEHVYTRDELKEDIELLENILARWNKVCRAMDAINNNGLYSCFTEEEIWNNEMLPKYNSIPLQKGY